MAYYIGIMSGTSLDGIDIALVDIDSAGQCQFVSAETISYTAPLLDKLQRAITAQSLLLKTLGQLDVELGVFIAEQINVFLQKQHLSHKDITAIGNHGQTLFHSPGDDYAFSQQIGNNNNIAELTGITTIGDLRQRDISVDGQGAPMVPAFHQQQFSTSTEDRVILNIGGIANITFLPRNENSDVIGFDTGPGNGLLNSWIKQHQNKDYDRDGEWAKSGEAHPGLLKSMLADPYFHLDIPKSTGREYFNLNWIAEKLDALSEPVSSVDVQATLVELTAVTISQQIECHCPQANSIFICGGGAHNPVIVSRISELNQQRRVSTTSELGLSPDWVESCAFAWLAYRTLNGLTGNLPSVTGAKKPVILGAIYPSSDVS